MPPKTPSGLPAETDGAARAHHLQGVTAAQAVSVEGRGAAGEAEGMHSGGEEHHGKKNQNFNSEPVLKVDQYSPVHSTTTSHKHTQTVRAHKQHYPQVISYKQEVLSGF